MAIKHNGMSLSIRKSCCSGFAIFRAGLKEKTMMATQFNRETCQTHSARIEPDRESCKALALTTKPSPPQREIVKVSYFKSNE